MRKLLLLGYFSCITAISFGQIKAVTNNGDEVILNADGTWKYVNPAVQNENKVDTNSTIFSKPVGSSFLVKSSKLKCGVYIDPKKWSFNKSGVDEASEFDFTMKEKDAFALIITEKTEIPLETLGSIALENAKAVAPDIAITKQEYRKVNGNTILLIEMSGTLKGIKVSYIGYYFSSSEGSVQLITYSATNLISEYKNDLEQFLNGFVTTK